jgi:hypothetical protein
MTHHYTSTQNSKGGSLMSKLLSTTPRQLRLVLTLWSTLTCMGVSYAWDEYDQRQENNRAYEQQHQQEWQNTEEYARPRHEAPSNEFGGPSSGSGGSKSEAESQQWLRNEERQLEQLRRQSGSRDRQLLEEQLQRWPHAFSDPTPPAMYGGFCCDAWGNRYCQFREGAAPLGVGCMCPGQGYGVVCQ